MIDWHSHILPGMDDGSKNVTESISLLNMQAAQGVDTVVATPHFYANDESVDSFLRRREKSHELLRSQCPDIPLRTVLGAEVRYYPGISRLTDLKALQIGGTHLLLLEMPGGVLSDSTIGELLEMNSGSTQIILAHVERFLFFQKAGVRRRILEGGFLIQTNAGFYNTRMTRRKALSLLRDGYVHLIGSDCHNLASRPPRIGQAYEVIQRKFGDAFLSQMDDYGHSLLVSK